MTHHTITHIDDVLPAIEGRSDFIVAHKDGYSVIDYVYTLADSFDDPIRAECRGIKFAASGDILARPLHKFKNIGECAETQPHLLDFTKPHIIMEKLDGSMIHPAIVDDDVVFMTRMGRTDVARKAERHLTPELADILRGFLSGGATPIFEFTAPDNRIVVSYPESALTLLAVRNTIDGQYWPRRVLEGMGLPLVRVFDPAHRDAAGFVAYARAVLGFEGFVVQFADGLWVKAKGDDYVMKHKAKDSILQEKNLLTLVLSGAVDDVLPLLDAPDAAAVSAYRDAVAIGVAETCREVEAFVDAHADLDQKAFAMANIAAHEGAMRSLTFLSRKGDSATEHVPAYILANTGSQTSVDNVRPLFRAVWS